MTDPKPYSLDDKYLLDDGTVALSGVQALVRLPIDQHKADARGAGFTKGAIYASFPNKQALIDAVVERRIGRRRR